MANHSHYNPDRDQCIEIILRIDKKIPKRRYARRVQAYMLAKGQEVPHIFKINNVRNLKAYDLDIAKALEAISNEKEEAEPPKDGYTMKIPYQDKITA